jgi:hypothetical protein
MDLQSLRAALEPLTKFGSDEHTFDVEGTTVTLRPLLPKEEIAAQQYASEVLVRTQEEEGLRDEDPLTRTAALRYMDQFRIEVVSYAIVQINGTDLRQIEHIETGEVTDSGVRVKVPRHVALRDIMTDSWSRGMITIAFSKYGDLITKIAEKADKVAEASVADLDAEIERLERRLASAKRERERRAAGDPGVTYDQIRGLVSAGDVLEREVAQAVDVVQADREAAEAIRAAGAEVAEFKRQVEESKEEEALPPPHVPSAVAAAVQARQPVIPQTAPPPTPKVHQPPNPDGFVSSFADPEEDPNALEADQARIAAAQRQAKAAARAELGDPLSRAKQVGTVMGPKGEEIPTFQLPSETISGRGRKAKEAAPPEEAPIDQPKTGSLNPNFKPPGR